MFDSWSQNKCPQCVCSDVSVTLHIYTTNFIMIQLFRIAHRFS